MSQADVLFSNERLPSTTITIQTMKAAVLESSGHFSIRDVPVRQPNSNEVLVRLEGCGVCGSNLCIWEGRPWFSYPIDSGSPGHEGWGYIVAIGDEVKNVSIGQRVTMISNNAFAQYETVTADSVVPLPINMSHTPFPGEPLGCAMNIFSRCNICKEQRVAIIGGGFIGTLLTSLASNAGALVTVFSRRPYSLQISKDYGAVSTFCIQSHNDLSELISRHPDITTFDCVIEATGYQLSLDLAGKLLKNRGHLVIAGYHQDGPRTIDMQLWNWRGIDVTNAHERDPRRYIDGIKAAIQAHSSGVLSFESLLTHTFSLEKINEAFQMLVNRPDGFMKALVML